MGDSRHELIFHRFVGQRIDSRGGPVGELGLFAVSVDEMVGPFPPRFSAVPWCDAENCVAL